MLTNAKNRIRIRLLVAIGGKHWQTLANVGNHMANIGKEEMMQHGFRNRNLQNPSPCGFSAAVRRA
ncbi:TPA: hypothetical protein ACQ7G8_000352 [Klebsiella pneumoniae]